jgi:outer membrane protein TolC
MRKKIQIFKKIGFFYTYIILWMGISLSEGQAQERLTLQSAVEQALKNNYSIQFYRNAAEINKNEISLGNAGMLPTLALNAGESFSLNNTKQNLSTGAEINRKNAQSTNATAGVALNWTLFDGMKMFATFEKLKNIQQIGEFQLRQQMENTVSQVISGYLDIIRQKQLLNVLDTTIIIGKQRAEISERKWQIGSASKMEFLQSTVDLNEQKSARMQQQLAFENAKSQLNVWMGKQAESEFEVVDTIVFSEALNLEELKNFSQSNNTVLALIKQNMLASELSIKEIKSGFYPKLIGNVGYNFSRATNQASIILLNQNLGLNAGLALSWNVFDGLNLRRKIKSAELSLAGQKIQLKDNSNQLESAVVAAFRKYSFARSILALEIQNKEVAKEAELVAIERFRTGSSNILELKDVQKALLDAETRLVNAQFDAKMAETELLRLQGKILN